MFKKTKKKVGKDVHVKGYVCGGYDSGSATGTTRTGKTSSGQGAAPQAQRLLDRGSDRAGGKNHKKTDAPAASSPYGQYHLVNLADNHF